MPEGGDPIAASYFSEVGAYKLPTKAEEYALFVAYRKALTREELGATATERESGARERTRLGQQIACGYLRFVILQARRRTHDPQLLKDLISQGNIGLMIGIQRFDPHRKVRFLTYAANWIVVHMQEHLAKLSTVHVPNHTRKELRRLKTQQSRLIAKGELRDYTVEEPNTAPIDLVPLAAPDDTESDAVASECDMFAYMDEAALSRRERLALTYTYGLRGTELEAEDLVQLCYELDGSIFSVEEMRALVARAGAKLGGWLRAKGVEAVSDLI